MLSGGGMCNDMGILLLYVTPLKPWIESYSNASTVYDLPAAQSEPLRAHLGLEKSSYTWLVAVMYAVSTAPNIVLPLLSGLAVQKYGARVVLLVTMALVCCGQAYYAMAVHSRSPVNMIVGRFLYGLGSEMSGAVIADLISQRFA
jgi:MFS family permease